MRISDLNVFFNWVHTQGSTDCEGANGVLSEAFDIVLAFKIIIRSRN